MKRLVSSHLRSVIKLNTAHTFQQLHSYDTDLRALRHVRNLLESLYERVFDVEGPSAFSEEDAIKQSMTAARNQIDKMERKVKSVETAKQLLDRVENLL